MASIYQLKPAFQNLLRPTVRALASLGVSANQVTVFACICSLAVGFLIWRFYQQTWILFTVPAFMVFRMALNAIDGMLAREHGMASPLGGILNELTDVVSDAALFLPFYRFPGYAPELVVAVVLLAIMVEMTGVIAVQIGASRRYDGPLGKSDRAFVFGALALAMGMGLDVSAWINWLLGIMAILSLWTIFNRARRALGELEQRK